MANHNKLLDVDALVNTSMLNKLGAQVTNALYDKLAMQVSNKSRIENPAKPDTNSNPWRSPGQGG